jgi:acylphosphatase
MLRLTGFVKNLHDGSVEMFVQGPEGDVSQCLAEIQSEFQGYITDTKTTPMTPKPSYAGFQITF